jgi:hypothetical protein
MDILDDIKNKVKDLPEQEVRSYLQFILYRIALLEDKENSLVEFAKDLKEIFNEILYPKVTDTDPFGKSNYRVRKLIEAGIFEYKGSLEAMRYYSIKFK